MIIRRPSPEEPIRESRITVLAGEDCLRAIEAWKAQEWAAVQTDLADLETTAAEIERAYA